MTDTDLLNHLLRSGVTPSFSFPLDVAEFRGEGRQNWKRQVWPKMSTDLKLALSVYSPGKVLTVDGLDYKVSGLYIYGAEDEFNRAQHHFSDGIDGERIKYYNRCKNERCGWVSQDMENPSELDTCPICEGQDSVETGIWYRPDGFAPQIVPWDNMGNDLSSRGSEFNMTMKPQKVTQSSEFSPSGGVEFPAPLTDEAQSNITDITIDDVSEDLDDYSSQKLAGIFQRIGIRSTPDDGKGVELLLINSGYNGNGYVICELCGYIDPQGNLIQGAQGHYRPYAADIRGLPGNHHAKRRCQGMGFAEGQFDRVFLGMTFRTDMIMFSIPVASPFDGSSGTVTQREINDAMLTLKEALITEFQKAAKLVNREIKGGVRKRTTSVDGNRLNHFEIFLYDDFSGGAGLTPSLLRGEKPWSRFIKVLQDTEERLNGSMCLGGKGCDKACLGCLLDFRNKDEHDRFDRRQGLRLLRFILHGDPPTIETGSNDVGDEEMERIVRMIQQPLEMLQDPDIVLTHSEGALDISKEGRRIRIRPRIPYVDAFEDPILSKWIDEGEMFEQFDENIPCPQDSTTYAEISLSYLERNPSNFAEAIHRIMNPGYL